MREFRQLNGRIKYQIELKDCRNILNAGARLVNDLTPSLS